MARTEQPTISVIVPARNEASNLRLVLPELPTVEQVVLVDGNSVDGTAEVAQAVMPGITVVDQTGLGKGNALVCGFAAATGDVIVMFDADGSADPVEIARFVGALTAGADFAKGTRFHPDGDSRDITRVRRAGNWMLNQLTNRLFNTRFTDLCYGYNAFWRDIVPALELPPVELADARARKRRGDGFEIETMLNCRAAAAGMKIVEVPSVERRRIFGETALQTFADGWRVLWTILAEKRRTTRARHSVQTVVGAPAAGAAVPATGVTEQVIALTSDEASTA